MPDRHHFEDVADHLGDAYLRYSFTKGTEQEVEYLVGALDLTPGQRLLDVGCGPGRHSHALAKRGIEVVGIDISATFVALAQAAAPSGATFVRLDARDLPYAAEFDAAISLCQGAFGLVGAAVDELPVTSVGLNDADPDGTVLEGMARALRPGGRLAVSAFSAYFQVHHLEETDTFDTDRGVNREMATLKNSAGEEVERDLYTSCFTPRELRLLADRAGLKVDRISSVTPGRYGSGAPTLNQPEFLLLATRR